MTVPSFNPSFAAAPQFARQTPPSLEQRQAMFTQLAGRSGDTNLLELIDITGTPLEKSPIAMGLQQEAGGVSFETLETKMQQALNGRSQFGGQLNFAQGGFPFAQGFNNGGSTGFPPIPPFAQGFNNINGNRGGQSLPSLEEAQSKFQQLAGSDGLLQSSELKNANIPFADMIAQGIKQNGGSVSFETLHNKMEELRQSYPAHNGQPPFAQGFNNINGNRGGQSLPSLEEAQSKFQQLAGSDGLLQSSELKNANIPFADMIAHGIEQNGGSVSFETVHNKMEELRQSYPAHNGQPPFAQGFNNGVGSGFPFAQGGNMPQFPAFAQGFNSGVGSGFPFAQGGNMPQFPAFAQGFNGGLFLN
jgi:hypothetical protein